jgi:hypothetical protein
MFSILKDVETPAGSVFVGGQKPPWHKRRLISSLWAAVRKYGWLAFVAASISACSLVILVDGLFHQYGGRTFI